MYKAMLVDDDYPVLEFLSQTIEWEKLGVVLQSTHENGASAYEAAAEKMPDILITDIGMPKMNGIELIEQLKERSPNLQVAILSCHSDFDYAHQALKLQVQDYLIKDTLKPEDLYELIKKFKKNLDDQNSQKLQHIQMANMLDRNKDRAKESFIRKTIDLEIKYENDWLAEAQLLGLQLTRTEYFPCLGMVHNFNLKKEEYISEDTLRFAINNVVEEALQEFQDVVHFMLGARGLFVFFPSSSSIKMNAFSRGEKVMKKIQYDLKRSLNISLSFLVGGKCNDSKSVKGELTQLLNSQHQSFYLDYETIVYRRTIQAPNEDLFAKYDEAATEMKKLIMLKNKEQFAPFVNKWILFLEEKKFPPELVKDWVLKLLIDLRVKLHALKFFKSEYTVESLHNELHSISFLNELKEWLNGYFIYILSIVNDVYEQTRRREILDAFRYVSMNIEQKINLEEVANHLYLNPSYFSRLFKKEVGETFVEYVTKMKVSRAKELLEQTSDSVGRICERLGYDNQSYFTKLFKNYVGSTPAEYRG